MTFSNHSNSLSPEAIKQHFERHWEQHVTESPTLSGSMESHLQFFTVQFDRSRLHLSAASVREAGQFCRYTNQIDFPTSEPEQLINEFGKIYFRLAKHMFGNHLGRKRKQQPLTYVFVDFEGTRSSKPVKDILKSRFPHVHAVMLVPPKCMTPVSSEGSPIPHSKSFYWAVRNPAVFWFPSIRDPSHDFQVKQFNPAKSSLEDLISYCMKGYLQVPKSYAGREDLWAVFPK